MQVPTRIWVPVSLLLGVALVVAWQAAAGYALLAGSVLLVVSVGFLTLRMFEVLWRNVHRIDATAQMRRATAWLVLLACVGIGLLVGAVVRAARIGQAREAAESFVPHLDAARDGTGRFPASLAELRDVPALPRFAAPDFYESTEDGAAFTLRLRAETGFVPDVWVYRSQTRAWAQGRARRAAR